MRALVVVIAAFRDVEKNVVTYAGAQWEVSKAEDEKHMGKGKTCSIMICGLQSSAQAVASTRNSYWSF